MKQKFTKLGVLLAMLLTILPASAYDLEVDGIYYNIVSFTEFTCEVAKGDSEYKGEVVIPSEVQYNNRTLTVVGIGNEAFSGCKKITSVTIPNTVTHIGKYAFFNCSQLKSITLPDKLTQISDYMFDGCNLLASVTIPNTVTQIGTRAFSDCGALTSITIPDNVTKIAYRAFENCISLTSITLPNKLTNISDCMFTGCTLLTSVTLPNTITHIESGAFSDCLSLSSITIPDSVESIGSLAFGYCNSLTSLELPNSVKSIGYYAFINCTALKNIYLGNSVTKIEYCAFKNCKSLESLTIPGSVVKIHDYYDSKTNLFTGCESLKEIKFLYGESPLEVVYSTGHNSDSFENWTSQIEYIYIDREILQYKVDKKPVMELPNLKKLTIGSHITKLQFNVSECNQLQSIISFGNNPPEVPYTYQNTYQKFTPAQYMNVEVKVPFEALEVYKADSTWGKFWNLEGFDAADMNDIKTDSTSKCVVGRFDLNGRPVSEDYKGVSIIRYSDGSTIKTISFR